MAKKTSINVDISVESIRDSLRKKIVSEHSQLIADIIIGNLSETEIGLQQLFKALSGTMDTFKYKVGDHVMVNYANTYGWQFNKENTRAAGMVIQEKIKAQVISINPYKKNCYELALEALDDSNNPKKLTMEASDYILCLEDEWPVDDPENPF